MHLLIFFMKILLCLDVKFFISFPETVSTSSLISGSNPFSRIARFNSLTLSCDSAHRLLRTLYCQTLLSCWRLKNIEADNRILPSDGSLECQFLEFDFALFYQLFHFEYSVLDCVASVCETSFFHLFVDPSYKFWQYADGKLDFDHPNPVASYKLRGV